MIKSNVTRKEIYRWYLGICEALKIGADLNSLSRHTTMTEASTFFSSLVLRCHLLSRLFYLCRYKRKREINSIFIITMRVYYEYVVDQCKIRETWRGFPICPASLCRQG